MSSTAPQVRTKTAGAGRIFSVSFAGYLDVGEKLTGTPVVTQDSKSIAASTDLEFSNQSVSTAVLRIIRDDVAIGEAVQFKVTGGTAGTTYVIKITVSTTTNPDNDLEGFVILEVTAN